MRSLAALVAAAAAGAASAYSAVVPVFEAYTTYPPCFRQPLLVPTGSNTLVVFAEGRNNTYCSGTNDGTIQTIVMKVSPDGGASWGPMVTLYTGHVDFLVAAFDGTTIHLMVQQGTGVLYSAVAPGGASFTPLTPIKLAPPAGVKSVQPAVGTGLVVDGGLCAEATCGGTAGRVVLPFICHGAGAQGALRRAGAVAAGYGPGDVACPGCYTCLLNSDDGGKSWAFGAVSTQDGTREASPVQLQAAAFPGGGPGAVVYANERNMGNATGSRERAVSLDGGATFAPALFASEPDLPDGCTANWTGVVSGASRFDTPAPGGGVTRRVIFTAPTSRTARVDMGLFVSADEARSWRPAASLLWSGPAAYSNTAQLNATHAGVIFENGEAEFAQRISFVAVAVADLPAPV